MRTRLGTKSWLIAAVAIVALLAVGLGTAVMFSAPAKVLASSGHGIVAGIVTNVSGSTLTVKTRQGKTPTVAVDGNAWVFVDGKETTVADVKTDMSIMAVGTTSGDNLTGAMFVFAHSRRAPAAAKPGQNGQMAPRLMGRGMVFGTVKSVDGNNVVITNARGTDQTIVLTNDTVIEQQTGKDLAKSDLTAGKKVVATVRTNDNNKEAQRIVVLPDNFNLGQRWNGQTKPQGPRQGGERPGFPGFFHQRQPAPSGTPNQ